MILPDKQLTILKALARYKFLTRAQMARLGIEQYNTNYSKYCNPLLKANLIGVQDARLIGLGHIYYIKKKGGLVLSQDCGSNEGDINVVKKTPTLDSNVFHRTYAIDCQIELFQSAEAKGDKVLFYEKDIDNSDHPLERKTRIPLSPNESLEPDAVFMLDTAQGRKLYCLEFEYRDTLQKSLKKALKYIKATNLKSVSKKYGHDKGHRTLFVYYDERLMHRVMEKLEAEVKGLNNWFLFKGYTAITQSPDLVKSKFVSQASRDFLSDWRTTKGEALSMC